MCEMLWLCESVICLNDFFFDCKFVFILLTNCHSFILETDALRFWNALEIKNHSDDRMFMISYIFCRFGLFDSLDYLIETCVYINCVLLWNCHYYWLREQVIMIHHMAKDFNCESRYGWSWLVETCDVSLYQLNRSDHLSFYDIVNCIYHTVFCVPLLWIILDVIISPVVTRPMGGHINEVSWS